MISKILRLLPDKWNLAIRYFKNTKHILHFNNPKRFTEKLQLYKLEKNFPLMPICHDKYTVHSYVKEKGLGDILIPIYQVVEKSADLDFDSLPDKFVMKTTNWGSTNIFCYDKSTFDWEGACKQLDEWVATDILTKTMEKSLISKPRIIIEKMLENDETGDIPDYKFDCFNGKVVDVFVVINRMIKEKETSICFVDAEYNFLPYYRNDFAKANEPPKKPENWEMMLEIAQTLAEGFPHVRVDLYNIYGKIYFGEMTFITQGGYYKYQPDEFDFILGEKFTYYGKKK